MIDSTMLLDQSLDVEKILTKIKACTEKIASFWHLYYQENLNSKDLKLFLKLTHDIAENLLEIHMTATAIEKINSDFASRSNMLCFSISQFYLIVLRDSRVA